MAHRMQWVLVALGLGLGCAAGCGLMLESPEPILGQPDAGPARRLDGGPAPDGSPRPMDAAVLDAAARDGAIRVRDGALLDAVAPVDARVVPDGVVWGGETCSWGGYMNERYGCSDGWECSVARTCFMGGICIMRGPTEECLDGGLVCGCDGVTYPDDCARQAAGVPLYSVGACVSP